MAISPASAEAMSKGPANVANGAAPIAVRPRPC